MRMIFEEDDKEDFLEIGLNQKDLEMIEEGSIVKNFPKGFFGNKKLNLLIYMEDFNKKFMSELKNLMNCETEDTLSE